MHTQKPPIAVAAALLTIVVLASMAQAGQVRLSWDAPTTNADGTPLTDLAGYMLYYGRTSRDAGGTYEFSLDVGNQTTYTLSGLQDGQRYYFSVTAYDTSANESDFSNEVSAAPSTDPTIPAGLLAAYSFDEGKGTTVADASGNGNTGTLKNGPTWTTGKYGGALSFDGVDDYVAVPNSASLDIAGKQLTIALWVNITDRSGPDMVLLGKPWSSAWGYPYYQYAIEYDANGAKTLDFLFGDTAGTLRGPFSMKPPVGVWTHVAFTYDGANVKGYLNGVQQFSVPETSGIQARGTELRLGVDGAFGQAFQGKLDEVRLYNRALTASEIQADMNTSITPPPIGAPVAAFSGTPTAGPAPLTVAFSDASSGSITAWSWDFGDGATSTAQNPAHTYSSPGAYTVSLTVTGPGGSNTATKTNYISVAVPPPVAAFSGTPTAGLAPLTVAFSDASSGSITAWSWDFGDGATSTAQNPAHTYSSPGAYTVSLTVTGPGGSNTATKTNYISVAPPSEPPPVAAFSATPTVGPAPLTVAFSDASSGSITAWSWDFGDGATSTAQNPAHTYSSPGAYTVSLTVTGPGGSASEVKTNYITVSPTSTGLAAAYSFDEGKGTTVADASGNGNTGTLKNGPTWTTGKYGGALSFDGVNDYVAIPNSASLNIAGKQLTIALWVNITDRSGPDMVLLGKPWSSAWGYPYYQYAIEYDANGAKTLDFLFGDTAGTLRGPFSLKPPVGVWVHVAFTYDGTAVRGYLNGVQKFSTPASQSIQARGTELRIGVDGAVGQAFKGRIDQVRIYNRALTASEIQADMNTPIK